MGYPHWGIVMERISCVTSWLHHLLLLNEGTTIWLRITRHHIRLARALIEVYEVLIQIFLVSRHF